MNKEVGMNVIDLNVELLRATEVATILAVSRSKAYEMIASGELPSIRIGKYVRVPRARLYEWIDAHTEMPEAV